MAIFQPSPLASAISGAVGGAEFVVSGRGAYIRKRQLKINHQPPSLLEARRLYLQAIREWTALSEASKLLWAAVASQLAPPDRLGRRRPLPPMQTYLRAAIPNYRVFGSWPDEPAADPVAKDLTGIAFTDPGDIAMRITTSVGIQDPAGFAQLYMSFRFAQHERKQPPYYRLVFSGTTLLGGGILPRIDWPDDFAQPPAGAKVYAACRRVTSGAIPSPLAFATDQLDP